MRFAALLALALLVPACRQSSDEEAPAPTLPPVVPPPTFGAAASGGTVQSTLIVEASGLAASRAHPGVLWTHNDSGNPPQVFALTPSGTHLGLYDVTGVPWGDWEDMALGPGPGGVDHLYVGNIGDNEEDNPSITIYRIAEPAADPGQAPVTQSVTATALPCVYPDGPHNAETLLCDPRTGDLFIVTKNGAGNSGLYRYPAPQDPMVTFTLLFEGSLTFGAGALPGSSEATGGDISADGTLIAIRSYSHVFVWTRQNDQAIAGALSAAPAFTMAHAQAGLDEAVAFAEDGSGMFTVNEGASPPIYFIPKTN